MDTGLVGWLAARLRLLRIRAVWRCTSSLYRGCLKRSPTTARKSYRLLNPNPTQPKHINRQSWTLPYNRSLGGLAWLNVMIDLTKHPVTPSRLLAFRIGEALPFTSYLLNRVGWLPTRLRLQRVCFATSPCMRAIGRVTPIWAAERAPFLGLVPVTKPKALHLTGLTINPRN